MVGLALLDDDVAICGTVQIECKSSPSGLCLGPGIFFVYAEEAWNEASRATTSPNQRDSETNRFGWNSRTDLDVERTS